VVENARWAVPPIIADDNGDITMFPTVADAEQDVEAIDVVDGAYEFFDSAGSRLAATAIGTRVQIARDPQAIPNPDELDARLRNYVVRVGPQRVGVDEPDSATLPVLVDALLRFLNPR
jgi:hypothetical protein